MDNQKKSYERFTYDSVDERVSLRLYPEKRQKKLVDEGLNILCMQSFFISLTRLYSMTFDPSQLPFIVIGTEH